MSVKRLFLRLLFLLLVGSPAICQEPTYCLRPVGTAIRDLSHEHAQEALAFASNFVAPGHNYLYLRKISQKTVREADRTVLLQSHPNVSVTDQEEIIDSVEKKVNENGEISYWFFETNSATIRRRFQTTFNADLTNGGTLEMREAVEKRFLSDYDGNGNGGFVDILSSVDDIDLVMIETPDELPANVSVRHGRHGPLVMQIRPDTDKASVSGKASLFNAVVHADPSTTLFVNLMPVTPEQSSPWAFDDQKAELYAVNGARIAQDLKRYDSTVVDGHDLTSKSDLISRIKSVGGVQQILVLIGESGPDGYGIRIPSRGEILTDEDFKSLGTPNLTIVGLICHSNTTITGQNSLSVAGALYTDETRRFLRLAFDNRPSASTNEYIGVAADFRPITNTVVTFEDSIKVPMSLVLLSGSFSGLSQSSALYTPTSTPTASSSTSSGGQNSSGGLGTSGAGNGSAGSGSENTNTNGPFGPGTSGAGLIISAIVGGMLRELIRWKGLKSRNRADLYLKPKYLIISGLEIALGIWVALIFSNLVDTPALKAILCFVCGVGIEEIVRRAARLKIWIPSVPQGTTAHEPSLSASVLEFLRA